MELSAPPSETEYGSSRRHKHKKRSKWKHRHREETAEVRREETAEGRRSETEGEEHEGGERQPEMDKLAIEVSGMEGVDAGSGKQDGEILDAEEASLVANEDVHERMLEDGGQQVENEQQETTEHPPTPNLKQTESSGSETEEEEPAVKKLEISLVPYQDSSATEVEQPGDTPRAESGIETAGAIQKQSTTGTIPDSELPASSPVAVAESPSADDCMDEITLHVEETIEGAGVDVDTECPSQECGKWEELVNRPSHELNFELSVAMAVTLLVPLVAMCVQ